MPRYVVALLLVSSRVLAVPHETTDAAPKVDPHAKEEAEAVLNMLVPAAKYLLEKNGEMFPIGAAMQSDGKVSAVAAFDGDEHPSSQKVIDGLNEIFRAGARQRRYKATGIALEIRVVPPGESEKTDAIASSRSGRRLP